MCRQFLVEWRAAKGAAVEGDRPPTVGGGRGQVVPDRCRVGVRRFTVWELVAVIAVVLLVALLLLPVLSKARDSGPGYRRMNCAGNLKQIGLSLLMYAMDFEDQLPNGEAGGGWFPAEHPNGGTNFEPLISTRYMQDGKVWACPCRKEVLTTGANSAYRYIGSGLKDGNAWATGVSLAYDVSGNHPDNDWVNVLFVDGHVEWGKPGRKPFLRND